MHGFASPLRRGADWHSRMPTFRHARRQVHDLIPTVGGLQVRWRFRLTRGSTFGAFASTPLVLGDTVYPQDLSSSVHALDARKRGAALEVHRRGAERRPERPRLLGRATLRRDRHAAFALEARTGRQLWALRLTNRHEQFVDIAPIATRGRVFSSTVGFAPAAVAPCTH